MIETRKSIKFNIDKRPSDYLTEIDDHQKDLESTIRNYVSSQLEFWKQIPYATVLASNKEGNEYKIYKHLKNDKYYGPVDFKRTYPITYIKCFTGQIITYHMQKEQPASTLDIINLTNYLEMSDNLFSLDAKKTLENLIKISKLPEKEFYNEIWLHKESEARAKEEHLSRPLILRSKEYFDKYRATLQPLK